MEQDAINLIGQASIATLCVIACVTMWRKMNTIIEAHLKDLRDFNVRDLSDLRARVMVLEDVNHVPRSARFDYMPGKAIPDAEELERIGKN